MLFKGGEGGIDGLFAFWEGGEKVSDDSVAEVFNEGSVVVGDGVGIEFSEFGLVFIEDFSVSEDSVIEGLGSGV